MEEVRGALDKHRRKEEEDDDEVIAKPKDDIPINQMGNNEQQQHPAMMNDVVLKHLFEILGSSQQELNRIRQVCKKWYKVVLPTWLKRGPTIVIKSDRDNDAFLEFLQDAHLNPSTEHEDIVGIKKYRRFHLEHHDTLYNGAHFQVFWNQCGEHLTHLTLRKFEIPDPATFKDILFCTFTPNLECLVVDVESVGVGGRQRVVSTPRRRENRNLNTLKIDLGDGVFPLKWKTLLHTFSNLKYFGVGRHLLHEDSQMEKILRAINEIRTEDKTRLDLKSFIWFFNWCFHFERTNSDSDPVEPYIPRIPPSLVPVELNLETVKLAIRYGDLEESIEQLLSAYGRSLKNLEIFRCGNYRPSRSMGFPRMPRLDSLKITGYSTRSLVFLENFPNLRSLALFEEVKTSLAPPERLFSKTISQLGVNGRGRLNAFLTMTEFRCDFRVGWTTAEVFGLLRLMPNLSHLEMALNDVTFPLVCRHLTQLEHLYVQGDDLGDRGIIGNVGIGGRRISNIQPNIERLSNLKSFQMEWGRDLLAGAFTEVSVIHGFLEIPRLEKLVILVDDLTDHADLQRAVVECIPFVEIRVRRSKNECTECGCKRNWEESDSEEEDPAGEDTEDDVEEEEDAMEEHDTEGDTDED